MGRHARGLIAACQRRTSFLTSPCDSMVDEGDGSVEDEDGGGMDQRVEQEAEVQEQGDPGLHSLLVKGYSRGPYLIRLLSGAPSLITPVISSLDLSQLQLDRHELIAVGDLEFTKQIGQGNHGVIFVAWHRPTGRPMAVKEIPIETAGIHFRQVVSELSVLSQSQSPFIINFFGAFLHSTSVFLCLELMEMGSLSRLMRHQKDEPIPSPVLAAITYQVILGMEFLRTELQMAHRGMVWLS